MLMEPACPQAGNEPGTADKRHCRSRRFSVEIFAWPTKQANYPKMFLASGIAIGNDGE
jgi:hypothetical protein